MNSYMVKIIVTISMAASILFIVGLLQTINNHFFKEAITPDKATSSDTISLSEQENLSILALGDSLTRGTGDSSGKGYIGYIVDDLKVKVDENLSLTNIAIKGQTSVQILTLIKQSEIQRQIKQANVIIMTIGGNDLFQSGEGLENTSLEEVYKVKTLYLENIQTLYTAIRELNPETVVFHVGLYNPFSELSNGKMTSAVVRDWNFATAEVTEKFNNIIYVPTFDLFQLHVNDYLFNDKFHPNEIGYKLIGERVASLLTYSFKREGATNE